MVPSITRRPANADGRARLREDNIAQHGERRGNTARGRVGQHGDIQQAPASE